MLKKYWRERPIRLRITAALMLPALPFVWLGLVVADTYPELLSLYREVWGYMRHGAAHDR